MLLGVFQHTIDDKGRLSLPAKLRNQLGDELIVTIDLDDQVSIYPLPEYHKKVERLAELNSLDDDARSFAQMYLNAHPCEMDGQGRVMIPQAMRDYAQLGGDVVVQGMIDHLEITESSRWWEMFRQRRADSKRLSREVAAQGLLL